MAIPQRDEILLPILNVVVDGKEHRLCDVIDELAERFSLSEKERNEYLPNSPYKTFNNRVGWARLLLVKSGHITPTRRGYFRLSRKGRSLLRKKLRSLSSRDLK